MWALSFLAYSVLQGDPDLLLLLLTIKGLVLSIYQNIKVSLRWGDYIASVCTWKDRQANDGTAACIILSHMPTLSRISSTFEYNSLLSSLETTYYHPFTSLVMRHYFMLSGRKYKQSSEHEAPLHFGRIRAFFIGLFFWDYGNAFLLEARRAGADVSPKDSQQEEEATSFRYPSYVQDIMG